MDYVIDVFNKYDIRGCYPKEINEKFTLTLGKATGTYCRKKFRNKKIAVGMDTRLSSKVLKDNLIKGLLLTGIDVVDIGKATTEKTALAGGHYNCAFSVMITASHHSFNCNGFKFIYNKGNGFSNEDMAQIKKIFLSKKFCKGKGKCTDKSLEFDKIYEEKICIALEEYIDVDKLKGVKVVADLCNSFASKHLVNVLEKYKCDVTKVNCKVLSNDMSFKPEPQKENRQYVAELIKKTNADIGIGIDPDGDRIFVFDSNGEWVEGNEIFCLLSGIMNPKKIVASLDTSSMLEEHAKDAKIIYTKIGDIFVSEKAIEIDADFLGEPNGHFAFPKFCWYNSGTFAGLKLCSIAKKIPCSANPALGDPHSVLSVTWPLICRTHDRDHSCPAAGHRPR